MGPGPLFLSYPPVCYPLLAMAELHSGDDTWNICAREDVKGALGFTRWAEYVHYQIEQKLASLT